MRTRTLVLALVMAATVAAPAAAMDDLPPGFQEQAIGGFTTPTAFAPAPDRRIFVAEKRGRVKVILPGGAVRLVYDLSDHVNNYVDHGLLGIAVDRDFATNGYVYLYYVYENNANKPAQGKVARLTRITVRTDNTVANARLAPETTILGTYAPPPQQQGCPAPNNYIDCIPAETSSHNGGTVRVDPADGTLWLSVGDANFGSREPNRFRPQNEQSFAGKIVHIGADGRGLPGHPFCPGALDLTQVCTKLHAKGFRNPWRMTLRIGPHPPGPLVGDVGQNAKEEVDFAEPGRNYGWPCYEGDGHYSDFAPLATCQAEYAKEGTADASAPPLWAYAHGPYGGCVMAGPQYTGTQFPAAYRGSILVGDLVMGWLKRVVLDSSQHVVSVDDFGTGFGGVDLQQLPDGRIAYMDLFSNKLVTIAYDSSNLPPLPRLDADVTSGVLPLAVHFDGSGSTDPEGGALTYDWDFGDGSAHSTASSPTHTYTSAGRFTVRLTVSDAGGMTASKTVDIFAGDRAPTVQITSPADESLYRDGVAVTVNGTASDPEDGALPGTSMEWTVLLHHNTHVHPFDITTGASKNFTPLTDHDADSYYEITLKATDAMGLSASRTIELRPHTITFTLASDPPGAPLSYAGVEHVAPFTTQAAIGFQANLAAPSSWVAGSATWYWSSWSDGGAQAHTISIPAANTTITARYSDKADSDPPETTITSGPTQYSAYPQPKFEFEADEPAGFQCRVDAAAFKACNSPYKTQPLTSGWHTFAVRAIDTADNIDPTPASQTFKIIDTI